MWKFCSVLLIKIHSQVIRIRCLLWSSVSSPDWNPQVKQNLYESRSTTKESLNFSESTSSNARNKENMRLDVNLEILTPRIPQFSAKLNVENLCGKQTTQLKVLIVNPNGCIDSHCSVDDKMLFHNCLLLLMNKFFLLSAHVKMIYCCNNTIFDGSRYYFEEQFVISKAKQSKASLGKYMRDHLTFDRSVYFSRPIRFSRTLVCGLFKNPWFSCGRYFIVLLPTLLTASPLAFSAFAVRTLFCAPTIPPATQASKLILFLLPPSQELYLDDQKKRNPLKVKGFLQHMKSIYNNATKTFYSFN